MSKATEILALRGRIEQSRRLAAGICNVSVAHALTLLADGYDAELTIALSGANAGRAGLIN